MKEFSTLLLRVVTGLCFLPSGLKKVQNLESTVALFSKLGIAPFLTYIISFGELIGAIALIIGFYSRLATLILLPIMLGATYFIISGKIPNADWRFPFLLTTTLLVIYFQGGGLFAIKGFSFLNKIIPKALQDK